MSHRKHDTCQMHDKSSGMIRERSRDRFVEEKKEMEHELSHHKEAISKLLNDRYTVLGVAKYRGQHVVKFQHPTSHRVEKLTFNFEPNYNALENMWQREEH